MTLEADTLFLANWLDSLSPPPLPGAERDLSDFWDHAEDLALPPLLTALNRGGLLACYQGHANQYVLCSEYWIEDQAEQGWRKDVAALNNGAAPWFFIGLGCHISDWAQNTVGVSSAPKERSSSEKFMIRQGGGASATYGSSGYEYITANKVFGEKIFRRWTFKPPVFNASGPSTVGFLPSGATAPRSRWIAGELLWAAEADLLAALGGDSTYREMIAQYTYLGDPLMVLDAGPPVVTAVLRGDPDQEVAGEVVLSDLDGSNLRTLDITAKDEAGIDRLVVTDSQGSDLTAAIVTESLPAGAADHQEVLYHLEVPVRPFAHQVTVDVFDTGAPLAADRHYSLVLDVPMDAVILAGGQAHDPATFAFVPDTPVAFDLTITSGAAVAEQTAVGLTSGNLHVSGLVIERQDAHTLLVRFNATAVQGGGDVLRSVDLVLGEAPTQYTTTYVLQEGPQLSPEVALGRVFNYPNPMAGSTRFVIESGGAEGEGRIRVFSVAGRVVASIPFVLGGVDDLPVVEWNGRDGEGDELGNGTYLYRIELDQGSRTLVSQMQRLVVMR